MLSEFAQLVKDMRTAQKSYFKTRNNIDLETSKRLEKQVDAALEAMTSKQTQMFSDDTTTGRGPY
jgi:mitochondrial fission protein ELM1